MASKCDSGRGARGWQPPGSGTGPVVGWVGGGAEGSPPLRVVPCGGVVAPLGAAGAPAGGQEECRALLSWQAELCPSALILAPVALACASTAWCQPPPLCHQQCVPCLSPSPCHRARHSAGSSPVTVPPPPGLPGGHGHAAGTPQPSSPPRPPQRRRWRQKRGVPTLPGWVLPPGPTAGRVAGSPEEHFPSACSRSHKYSYSYPNFPCTFLSHPILF